MSDPATYRPAPGTIPTEPGVYKFRDENRRVVYVGKAKNLRARLSNYFQDITQLHPRTRQMVQTADSVEWTVVASEVEALQLEYTWIKRFDPDLMSCTAMTRHIRCSRCQWENRFLECFSTGGQENVESGISVHTHMLGRCEKPWICCCEFSQCVAVHPVYIADTNGWAGHAC